jgi:hypothetical protein
MDRHRTVLGALLIAMGAMGLIGIILILVIFSIGSLALGAAASNEPDIPRLLVFLPVGFGLLICSFIALTTIPNLIAAYGLLARRPWGRVLSLVVGILNLPNIPLGTGVGVYAIWVFLQEPEQPKKSFTAS